MFRRKQSASTKKMATLKMSHKIACIWTTFKHIVKFFLGIEDDSRGQVK